MGKKRINEVFENPLKSPGKGIFSAIRATGEADWLTESDALALDGNYYFSHSGEKRISPGFADAIAYQEENSTFDAIAYFAAIIAARFGSNWKKIHKAYFETDYSPLENYDMSEEEKQATKVKTVGKASDGVYGFNSNDPVPSDSGDSETVVSGDSDDNVRNLTRHGNIGVTTSQQMLQAELDLRKYDFFAILMADVDKILTLSIY